MKNCAHAAVVAALTPAPGGSRPINRAKAQERSDMTRYSMSNGTVLDTDKAAQSWKEATRWNGNNHISVATGSQWEHQTLYRSRKGRFYLEHESECQGSLSSAEWIDEHRAVAWLLVNGHEVPADLEALAEEVVE